MYVNPLYFGIAIGVVGTIAVEIACIVCLAMWECKKK